MNIEHAARISALCFSKSRMVCKDLDGEPVYDDRMANIVYDEFVKYFRELEGEAGVFHEHHFHRDVWRQVKREG